MQDNQVGSLWKGKTDYVNVCREQKDMEITLEKSFLHGSHVLFEAAILQISSSFILFQKGFHLSNVISLISLKKKWLFLEVGSKMNY